MRNDFNPKKSRKGAMEQRRKEDNWTISYMQMVLDYVYKIIPKGWDNLQSNDVVL